ncbi:MAG TPA: hypothetical protein VHC70_06795 [Phycisphaerales bacterium]|nr:hypothetical protein [Phycisphaerales bacterium]
MKPHSRIRKTIKWGGAAVTVLLVVVWIGSARWVVGRDARSPAGFDVVVMSGSVACGHLPAFRFGGKAKWWIADGEGRVCWLPHREGGGPIWYVSLPLWPLVAAVGLASFTAWRLDTLARRRERAARLNLCPKCNYNRAGLAADAKCPECGSAAP